MSHEDPLFATSQRCSASSASTACERIARFTARLELIAVSLK